MQKLIKDRSSSQNKQFRQEPQNCQITIALLELEPASTGISAPSTRRTLHVVLINQPGYVTRAVVAVVVAAAGTAAAAVASAVEIVNERGGGRKET